MYSQTSLYAYPSVDSKPYAYAPVMPIGRREYFDWTILELLSREPILPPSRRAFELLSGTHFSLY